jgi:hypothetical protein
VSRIDERPAQASVHVTPRLLTFLYAAELVDFLIMFFRPKVRLTTDLKTA